MSVFKALRWILREDTDIDGVCDGRVYPRVPQTPTFPLITLKEISCPIDALIDSASPRWQVTAWAEVYDDGEDLAAKIRYCLQRYSGVDIEGVTITQITFLNKTEVYEPETGRETFPTDFRVVYWEE